MKKPIFVTVIDLDKETTDYAINVVNAFCAVHGGSAKIEKSIKWDPIDFSKTNENVLIYPSDLNEDVIADYFQRGIKMIPPWKTEAEKLKKRYGVKNLTLSPVLDGTKALNLGLIKRPVVVEYFENIISPMAIYNDLVRAYWGFCGNDEKV